MVTTEDSDYLREEVMNECTESKAIWPGGSEVTDLYILQDIRGVKYFALTVLTSYSLVLHWHQIKMASICGDMQILLLLLACALVIPSSRATPAWVAIPPLLLFLWWFTYLLLLLRWQAYGLEQGDGFFVSSINPAMFLRNRLCMFFSSISFSLMLGSPSLAPFIFLLPPTPAQWLQSDHYLKCYTGLLHRGQS